MDEWKKIKFKNVKIKKCVAEFEIWEQLYSPYGKFKIKVYEDENGDFNAYSNLLVKDNVGGFYCTVGHGDSIEKALEDAIHYFFEMTSIKEPKEWNESDFMCSDSFDF